jgi:hypothetical protein
VKVLIRLGGYRHVAVLPLQPAICQPTPMGIANVLPLAIRRLPCDPDPGDDQSLLAVARRTNLSHVLGKVGVRIKDGNSNQFELGVLIAPPIPSYTTGLGNLTMGRSNGFSGGLVQSAK